jgi:hypothetical protein
MAEAADQAQHDFWRPPMSAAEVVAKVAAHAERRATCPCGTEFLVSSLFCHVCGAKRAGLDSRSNFSSSNSSSSTFEIPGRAELVSLAERLELPIPAVIAFLSGLFCVAGAFSVSIFFSVRTPLDWQAIQMWRIEWLLASVAAFAAGCLLKK